MPTSQLARTRPEMCILNIVNHPRKIENKINPQKAQRENKIV